MNNQHVYLLFFVDKHNHEIMSSNETHLTVTIADLIISEGLYFNLDQKPRLKKLLDLSRNISNIYNPPKRNIILKDVLYVIQ